MLTSLQRLHGICCLGFKYAKLKIGAEVLAGTQVPGYSGVVVRQVHD